MNSASPKSPRSSKVFLTKNSLRLSLFTALGIALFAPISNAAKQARKPNVIVIYTDDQKWEQFGVFNKGAYTPNIDILATKGAYFSNAYASSSVCSPSRYSVVTGQYASRCDNDGFRQNTSPEGVTKVLWNTQIDDTDWTWPKVMQQNGYKTGMVGKWHIGSTGWKPVPNGNIDDPKTAEVLKGNQRRIETSVMTRGFDYVGGVYKGNPDDDKNLKKHGWNTHHPEWYTKAALDFIDDNKDVPFALYFCPTLMHSPSPLKSLTKGDPMITPEGRLEQAITGIMPEREEVVRIAKAHGAKGDLIPATWHDFSIGAVMKKLDELGLTEDTLILYFNDNGTNDYGKGSSYQGGTHVPFFAYMPGTVIPGERKQLASNIDLATTIFDLTGVTPPEDMTLDGLSVMPILRGEAVPEWRDVLYHEIGLTRAAITEDFKYIAFHLPPSYADIPLEERMAMHKQEFDRMSKQNPWTKGLERWKLDPQARWMHMGRLPGGEGIEMWQLAFGAPFENSYYEPDQLFNLDKDPRETNNLASNPEYAAKLKEMKAKLAVLLDDVPGTYPGLKGGE